VSFDYFSCPLSHDPSSCEDGTATKAPRKVPVLLNSEKLAKRVIKYGGCKLTRASWLHVAMADSNPWFHADLSYLTNSSVHYDEDTEQFVRSQEVSRILFLCGRRKENAKELLDVFRLLVIRLLRMISSLLGIRILRACTSLPRNLGTQFRIGAISRLACTCGRL
jgi:hypothetical protein